MSHAEMLKDGTLTVPGLNREFGIPKSRAYEFMKSGRIPYFNVGRKRLIPRSAVIAFLSDALAKMSASTSTAGAA